MPSPAPAAEPSTTAGSWGAPASWPDPTQTGPRERSTPRTPRVGSLDHFNRLAWRRHRFPPHTHTHTPRSRLPPGIGAPAAAWFHPSPPRSPSCLPLSSPQPWMGEGRGEPGGRSKRLEAWVAASELLQGPPESLQGVLGRARLMGRARLPACCFSLVFDLFIYICTCIYVLFMPVPKSVRCSVVLFLLEAQCRRWHSASAEPHAASFRRGLPGSVDGRAAAFEPRPDPRQGSRGFSSVPLTSAAVRLPTRLCSYRGLKGGGEPTLKESFAPISQAECIAVFLTYFMFAGHGEGATEQGPSKPSERTQQTLPTHFQARR